MNEFSCRFWDPRLWEGGYYELALEVDVNLELRMLETLWHAEELSGFYLERDLEAIAQVRYTSTDVYSALSQPSGSDMQFGCLRLPEGQVVPCATYLIPSTGWVSLIVPLGGLSTVYDVHDFPFGHFFETWRAALDAWLFAIARRTFLSCPFKLGLVGFDVTGEEQAEKVLHVGVPDARWFGFIVPQNSELVWYPPTFTKGSPPEREG